MDMEASYDCQPFTWAVSFYVTFTEEAEFDAVLMAWQTVD
jgi:hypothetical protein